MGNGVNMVGVDAVNLSHLSRNDVGELVDQATVTHAAINRHVDCNTVSLKGEG